MTFSFIPTKTLLSLAMGTLLSMQALPSLAQNLSLDTFDSQYVAQGDTSQNHQWGGSGMRMGKGGPGGNPENRGKWMDELNLTPEQKQKLHTLMQSKRETMKGSHQALQAKRQTLMEMLRTGSGSRQEALNLQQDIANEQSKMMVNRINMVYEMRSILSPEQFEKFSATMQHRLKNHSGKGRHGGFRKPGSPASTSP